MPDGPRPTASRSAAIGPAAIRFVLVHPEHPGNVGATARALKNMGFDDLRIVGDPVLAQHPDAVRLAHGAEDLLGRIRWCATLPEALSGSRWAYGTTRRVRKPRAGAETLRGLRDRLIADADTAELRSPLAVVFGSEKDGLSFEDLALCQATLTIPTSPDHPSLNLAQAVLLVAWELTPLAGSAAAPPDTQVATHEELEALYEQMQSMLFDIGFVTDETAPHQMLALRGLLSRTLPTRREVTQLRGLCRQASWAATHPRAAAPDDEPPERPV